MQYLADLITSPQNRFWQHTINFSKNFDWNELTNHFAKEDGFTLLESQEEQISTTNKYSGIFLNPLEKVVSKLTPDNRILSYRTIYIKDVTDTISNTTTNTTKDLDLTENFDNIEVLEDPLRYIENSLQQLKKIASIDNKNKTDQSESIFTSLGYVGMLSYDYQNFLPKGQLKPLRLDKRIGLPLLHLCFFANAIIFDKERFTLTIYGIENFGYSKATIQDIIAKYSKPKEHSLNLKQEFVKSIEQSIEHTSKEKYLQDLDKIHQAIYAGDIYLLNYTTRTDQKLCAKPWDLFQKLRIQNPAPFAAFLSDDDWAVVSSSPELFIQVNDKHIKTKPIKGTISKTNDPKINQQHIKELQESIKERAELNMIVDLERNDLGKICKAGTVKVPEIFKIEEYPTLYHMVSTVEGQLKDNVGFSAVIKSMFPGGSITGTPKLSAMRHIAKYESTPRELYTGSIGYIGIDGNMNFNIVIRTIICKNHKAYVSTGGGITWDSIPEEEYKEVLLKAKALKKVLN